MRDFLHYRLLLVPLLNGAFLSLLVQPMAVAQEPGKGTVPANRGSALIDPQAKRPGKESPSIQIPLTNVNLGLTLVGTAVMENTGKSLAVFEHDDTGRQEACWEGGRLGRVLIKKILHGKVIIDAGAGEMILSKHGLRTIGKGAGTIASDSPATENVSASAYPARLDRKAIAEDYPDYSSLIKTARIRTHFQAGSPEGILIDKIDPAGLFGKMGLQEGDLIKEVNGEPLPSSQDGVKIYDRLKHGGRINLKVQRGEESLQLRFYVG